MPQPSVQGADAAHRVEQFVRGVQDIRKALHQVVVGQDKTIDLLLTCALTGSHALLVGVPELCRYQVRGELHSREFPSECRRERP